MNTILVVDDTQDNLDLIEDALGHDHQIVHARSGTEGIAKAAGLNPELILLDMAMPGMDGREVARQLKADRRLAEIPVVAVTALAMNGDRERCLASGCDDYLAKPFHIDQLRECVRSWLDAKHAVPVALSAVRGSAL